ncbi:hypothetical protein [Flavivirga rizhaonensis]|uniref:OmpH family outer membrane protein n=1 Tax=Flavivirga rizhaonensis TaxID=2559571 RepID=A0A4S1E100_9FLAO|nr:hypothetical protein [Flavivirga rizhaonensis]TGV03993.1 hypothetical protein EM932_04145 [Flavivirga rizhaonensis]
MNLQKTILSLLFFIIASSVTFAQQDVDSQINDLIKKDNVMLTENDKSLKLTEEQTLKLKEAYKKLVLFENDLPRSKKKKKEAYREAMTPILSETMAYKRSLLTSKQLAAYNAYDAR